VVVVTTDEGGDDFEGLGVLDDDSQLVLERVFAKVHGVVVEVGVGDLEMDGERFSGGEGAGEEGGGGGEVNSGEGLEEKGFGG